MDTNTMYIEHYVDLHNYISDNIYELNDDIIFTESIWKKVLIGGLAIGGIALIWKYHRQIMKFIKTNILHKAEEVKNQFKQAEEVINTEQDEKNNKTKKNENDTEEDDEKSDELISKLNKNITNHYPKLKENINYLSTINFNINVFDSELIEPLNEILSNLGFEDINLLDEKINDIMINRNDKYPIYELCDFKKIIPIKEIKEKLNNLYSSIEKYYTYNEKDSSNDNKYKYNELLKICKFIYLIVLEIPEIFLKIITDDDFKNEKLFSITELYKYYSYFDDFNKNRLSSDALYSFKLEQKIDSTLEDFKFQINLYDKLIEAKDAWAKKIIKKAREESSDKNTQKNKYNSDWLVDNGIIIFQKGLMTIYKNLCEFSYNILITLKKMITIKD